MKSFSAIIVTLLMGLSVVSCGESAKERQAREAAEEQRLNDSIAQVEAEKAKLEQRRLDSIASAERRAEKLAADSAVRAELLPAFIEEKNSDVSGASMFKVKTAPKGHTQNYAYLSFTVDNGNAREMFLNVCYVGADWINIEKCSLLIDNDNATDVSLGEISDDVINSNCVEWFSAPVSSGELDKLMEAKSVKVKLIGGKGNKEISLKVADMQKTIKLFRAFGG